jgi:hypothetical protein
MATHFPNGSSERSLGQLFSDASRDLTALVHSEIALAKSELRDDVKAAAKGGGMFGAAGFLGVVAFVLLSIAAAYGLVAAGLHPGWAFLIVAAVYLLLAAILVFVGRKQVKRVGPPVRTIETTKESVAALKGSGSAAGAAHR